MFLRPRHRPSIPTLNFDRGEGLGGAPCSTAGFLTCLAAPMLAADGEVTLAERTYLLDQIEQSKKGMLASERRYRVTPKARLCAILIRRRGPFEAYAQ
jgi:hypothetical protein